MAIYKRLFVYSLYATAFARTLFILDGLDEVSEGLGTDSELYPFLKFLLEQPNVIITSRPSARLPISSDPDLELETIGFYLDQVKAYVEKAFMDPDTHTTNSQNIGDVQSFLQFHLLFQSLVRIQIQLDALCFTWDEGFGHSPKLHTMTTIYQAIENRL